jgi:hypothetical protein
MKRGALWSIAEFWSWIAMFILILFAVIFFKSCSGPRLQTIQMEALTGISERQQALAVLRTPVVYEGQDVDLAFLISLGDVESEFDKVFPSIQLALRQRMAASAKANTLSIDYGGWKVMMAEDSHPVLDSVRLPSSSGSKIRVEVRSAPQDQYDHVVREFAKKGGWQYVTADGRVWVYWSRSPSGQSGVWSEEGLPCVTKREGDARVCVSEVSSVASLCFVDDASFSRDVLVDSAKCGGAS